MNGYHPSVSSKNTGIPRLISRKTGDQREHLEGAGVIDPQRRERMGRAARAVAEAHTWSCMARQYVDLFEHMAETPSRTFPVNA